MPSRSSRAKLFALLATAAVGGAITGAFVYFISRPKSISPPKPAIPAPAPVLAVPPEAWSSSFQGDDLVLRWYSQGKSPEAGEDIVFARSLLDRVPDLSERVGRFLSAAKEGDWGRANQQLESLAEAAGGWGTPPFGRLRELSRREWALQLLAEKNTAQAVLVLLDLEALSPEDRAYDRELGIAYLRLGDKEKAYDNLLSHYERTGSSRGFAYELAELAYYRHDLPRARELLSKEEPGRREGDVRQLRAKLEQEFGIESEFRETLGDEDGHFRVLFDGAQNAQAAYGARTILEQARRDVGRALDFLPQDKIGVVLYTKVQYRSALNAPDWAGALYDGKIRLPTGGLGSTAYPLKDTIYHEYVHAAVNRLGGENVPAWLHEGLAQALEPAARAYRFQEYDIQGRGSFPISRLERTFSGLSGPAVPIAYGTSKSFVGYLLQQHGGMRKIKALLAELSEGATPSSALRNVYGLDEDVLNQRWREAVERSARK
ncbi:MAG: hypothetical protein AB1405_09260 [Bdellovibrionota bacterium]